MQLLVAQINWDYSKYLSFKKIFFYTMLTLYLFLKKYTFSPVYLCVIHKCMYLGDNQNEGNITGHVTLH